MYRILVFAFLTSLFSCNTENSIKKNTQLKIQNVAYPNDRYEFEKLKRGDVSSLQLKQAQKIYLSKMKNLENESEVRDGGIMSWVDKGPSNVGGRIRCVTNNPNSGLEVLAGAAAGGIWKYNSFIDQWTLLNPITHSYPVTSIEFDPFDNDIAYATTGEYNGGGPEFSGIGLLKSIDGGDSWEEMGTTPNGQAFEWLNDMTFDPVNENVFYIVGQGAFAFQNDPTVFKTTDGGNSWTLSQIDNLGAMAYDIEINPNDNSELIVGTDRSAYISNDSGISFNQFNLFTPSNYTGFRCEVEYCKNNPETIYISRNLVRADSIQAYATILHKSEDGGLNWVTEFFRTTNSGDSNSEFNPLDRQGDYSHALWVDPLNCDKALIGGINLFKWDSSPQELIRITEWGNDINGNSNGGNNSVHADFHAISESNNYNGTSNSKVWLGNDGGLYSSTDIWSATLNSGWAEHNDGLNITQLYNADISNDGSRIVGGAQDNSFFVNKFANTTITDYFTFTTGDGGPSLIDKSNPDLIYSSTQLGSLWRSYDGGDSFCNFINFNGDGTQYGPQNCNFQAILDTTNFIAPFKIAPNPGLLNAYPIFFGGKKLWVSINEGDGWQILKNSNGSNISTIDIFEGNNNTIIVGHNNGDVYRSINAGSNNPTWTKIDDNGINFNGFITDIATNPSNALEIVVTLGGYNQVNIFYSDDGGISWNTRSLDFDIHVQSVVFHPTKSGWFYIGTDIGIFATEDNGVNWNITPLYSEGEGPIFTRVSELFWQNAVEGHYLCAATFGRGIWKTEYPILSKVYVDKSFSGSELGTISNPYNTFLEALDAVGNGAEIIFKSTGSGTYNEIPPSILLDKRIKITLQNGGSSVIIK